MKKSLFYLSALIYILTSNTLHAQQTDNNQPQAYIARVGDLAPDFNSLIKKIDESIMNFE